MVLYLTALAFVQVSHAWVYSGRWTDMAVITSQPSSSSSSCSSSSYLAKQVVFKTRLGVVWVVLQPSHFAVVLLYTVVGGVLAVCLIGVYGGREGFSSGG